MSFSFEIAVEHLLMAIIRDFLYGDHATYHSVYAMRPAFWPD